MSIIYKPLFEIKVLHEFFITNEEGIPIFDVSPQQARLDILRENFINRKMGIEEILEFKFPSGLSKTYESKFLKLIPSYNGCKVMIRVKETRNLDGSVQYTPFINFSTGDTIFINFIKKGSTLDAISGHKLKQNLNAAYLVSNEGISGNKTYPFLTQPVSPADSAVDYEQGETALSAANNIEQFYLAGGVKSWLPGVGKDFLNEQDRVLLPTQFRYRFYAQAGLSTGDFTINDPANNTVWYKTLSVPSGSDSVLVETDIVGVDAHSGSFQNAVHTLTVTGNNGYTASHRIVFSDALYHSGTWLLAGIRFAASNPNYNLLNAGGFLHTMKNADGTRTPHPVFEMNIKSRLPFWRYFNYKGKDLSLIPAYNGYLVKEGKNLVSVLPRPLSRYWLELLQNGSSNKLYIPNPTTQNITVENDGRMFIDIPIAESDLFPTI